MASLMIGRRMILAAAGQLAPGYRLVRWLYRDAAASGPYCKIDLALSPGDVLTTWTENLNNPNRKEQAFGGNYYEKPLLELYYQSSSGKPRMYSTSDVCMNLGCTFGPPDKMQARITSSIVLVYLGEYGGRDAYFFEGRIYRLTSENANGIILHDFLPCIRLSDGECGFYDRPSGTFYPNIAANRHFTPGNTVSP